MANRLTYEFVKEQFEKEGYELLEETYINSKTKMRYRCPEGHEHSISWGDWNKGRRCPYCSFDKKDFLLRMLDRHCLRKIMYC